MNRHKQLLQLVVLIIVVAALGVMSHRALMSDGWYHDVYCFGKIDSLDFYC